MTNPTERPEERAGAGGGEAGVRPSHTRPQPDLAEIEERLAKWEQEAALSSVWHVKRYTVSDVHPLLVDARTLINEVKEGEQRFWDLEAEDTGIIRDLESLLKECDRLRRVAEDEEMKLEAKVKELREEKERQRVQHFEAANERVRVVKDALAKQYDEELQRRVAAESRIKQMEGALRELAAVVEGHEGETAQRAMMHGFSPMRALSDMRDIARRVLDDKEEAARGDAQSGTGGDDSRLG